MCAPRKGCPHLSKSSQSCPRGRNWHEQEPKPIDGDNRRGRRVCAAVVCALLLALWPPLPRAATDAATLLAVLLLAWSFAGDTKYLLARRAVVKERA